MLNGCGFFAQKTESLPDSVRTHKVVRTACTQLGKRYRPGGASPQKGFDCSGLVWWSYRQHGINVPRITKDQAKAGRKVSGKAARPGDIVVFKSSNSPNGLHTGIYVGDGKFIHSPRAGKTVCMESMHAPHWTGKLVAIRRMADSPR